jgi:N-acetylglucosamine kinase-like BadF-type ATPase
VPFYAGIDGGQSSTTAVVADETGRILGRGRAGAADEVGQDAASTRLRDALGAALADAASHAKLAPGTRFERIVAGVSGYDGRVYGRPPELPTGALTLEHDAPIAHAGALGGEPGVIVIAGTGSVAYAMNEEGATALAGGWGYLFGDEGSAFWLARDALADAMRDEDSVEPNELAAIALQYFNLPSLRKLSRAVYSGAISRTQLASFASVIVQHAENGNARAAQYVCDGAGALVTIAMRAMQRVQLRNPKVAFVGGLFESPTVREQVVQWIRDLVPHAQHVQPKYDPAVGALLLAYRGAGITPPSITE